MKLIKMVCPNCNANLKIDLDNKEYKCEYCKTSLLVDDEIVKVEYTLNTHEKEEKIKVAETYLYELEEYDKAYEIYLELTAMYPYVADFWFCLIRALTRNFEEKKYPREGYLEECENYFNKYLKVEKDEKNKEKNKTIFNNYINNYYYDPFMNYDDSFMNIVAIIVILVILVFVVFGIVMNS